MTEGTPERGTTVSFWLPLSAEGGPPAVASDQGDAPDHAGAAHHAAGVIRIITLVRAASPRRM